VELCQTTPIEPHALPGEFMLNALRLIDGVDTALFTERTGLPTAAIGATSERLRQRGLLRKDRLALTTRGLLFLDSVVGEFL
jgi:oxygen-independent coproporphyrinogen-3 oxidase